MSSPARVKVEILPSEDWERLADDYASYGSPLPDPKTATIVAVTSGDRVLGHVAVHNIPVVGLLHVGESYRGGGVGSLLAKAVDELLNPGESIYAVVTSEEGAKRAEAQGMVRTVGVLYRKDKT